MRISLVLSLLVVLLAHPSFAAKPALTQKVAGGEIDWSDQCFNAVGSALTPGAAEEPNRQKAGLKARGNARTKAIANLLITIDACAVNHWLTAQNLMDQDDFLRRDIENLCQGAEAVYERQKNQAGESVGEVGVKVQMFGSLGVGTAMLRSLSQLDGSGKSPGQIRVETSKTAAKSETPSNQKGKFTGLIIDARGCRLTCALNPRIRQPDGSEIWGSLKTGRGDFSDGTVTYTDSLEAARRDPRVGKNPFIVRAIGRAGSVIFCDAVVSAADADRILSEEKSTHFLSDMRVMIVVDRISD